MGRGAVLEAVAAKRAERSLHGEDGRKKGGAAGRRRPDADQRGLRVCGERVGMRSTLPATWCDEREGAQR